MVVTPPRPGGRWHGVVGRGRTGRHRLSAAARRQRRSDRRGRTRRQGAPLLGPRAVRDAARDPRRPARRRLDDRRRQLARPPVHVGGSRAARPSPSVGSRRRAATTSAARPTWRSPPTATSSSPTAMPMPACSSTPATAGRCASGHGRHRPRAVQPAALDSDRRRRRGLRRRPRERPWCSDSIRRAASLGEWTGFGKTFGLKPTGRRCGWRRCPVSSPSVAGVAAEGDGASGRLLGWAPSAGNHGMDVMADGTLLLGPGPGLVAQRYRRTP